MKNKKRLLASLCCALMISAVPLGATSCNVLNSLFPSSESSSTGAPEVFEGGQYYNGGTGAAAEGANTLTLTEGGLISLTMDGELKEGTYTFQANKFAITFNDETTATAELKDVLSSKLQDLGITTLLFMKSLEMIEYRIEVDNNVKEGQYLLEKNVINDHCTIASALGVSFQEGEKPKDTSIIHYLKFQVLLKQELILLV